MLSLTRHEIEERARNLVERLSQSFKAAAVVVDIVEGESAVGGGSGPNVRLPTALIALESKNVSADEIGHRLRLFSPPIITRIADGRVLLDLRTVAADEESDLAEALTSLNAE